MLTTQDFYSTTDERSLFFTRNGLQTWTGVQECQLIPLAVKELTDNALDAAESRKEFSVEDVEMGLIPGGFYVQDCGPGMEREDMLKAFTVRRSLFSSKRHMRLPTRGAMGNGLRVVGGVAVAFGAELTVHNNGVAYKLENDPEAEEIRIIEESPSNHSQGVRVEMVFPSEDAPGEECLVWGKEALLLARSGGGYQGKPSPFWYTAADLLAYLKETDGTIRDLVTRFDSCSEVSVKALEALNIPGKEELDLGHADILLGFLRKKGKPFNPKNRIKEGSPVPGFPPSYATGTGEYEIDGGAVIIPFRVDAWAAVSETEMLKLYVNRTPDPGTSTLTYSGEPKRNKRNQRFLIGKGVDGSYRWGVDATVGTDPVTLIVNITTPHAPCLSFGKERDLSGIVRSEVAAATVKKAVNMAVASAKGEKAPRGERPVSQKDFLFARFHEAARVAGGDGKYEFSQRQLFYVMRPEFIEYFGKEPKWGTYTSILTQYENERGNIPGLYRDARGTLYVPHINREIPIGTKSVAEFKRPEWTFHKILYCEKEGFFPTLRAAKWPEKWDCALLTSKGYASRAVKDLLDMLEDDGEAVTCFCIHDADADGTMIYQTLVEATASRGKRKVEVINLGLDPAEALTMGLPSESVEKKNRKKKVARYIPFEWRSWFRKNRIELNAMTTPQFLSWLDSKMEQHGPKKLIPPSEVIREEFEAELLTKVDAAITERILKEAKAGEQIEVAFENAKEKVLGENWEPEIIEALEENPTFGWRSPVTDIAGRIAKGGTKGDQE